MQKCILLFNSLSNVFVHYEELYYRAWIIAVDRVIHKIYLYKKV